MSIELHIERLVLDEALLGGERAGNVRAALEGELARLLTRPGAVDALRGLGAVATLPPARLPTASDPHERLGPRIATAVQHGLGITPAARVAGKEH
ncbi:MAG: hypothetical protein ACTHOA_00560 [Rhodanobacter sp.]|nr:hypothetical protein [Rhodanobacter sp.]